MGNGSRCKTPIQLSQCFSANPSPMWNTHTPRLARYDLYARTEPAYQIGFSELEERERLELSNAFTHYWVSKPGPAPLGSTAPYKKSFVTK